MQQTIKNIIVTLTVVFLCWLARTFWQHERTLAKMEVAIEDIREDVAMLRDYFQPKTHAKRRNDI